MELYGYGQAVIHLVWFRDDKTRYLLFGMVELRPAELPHIASSSEKKARSGTKGRTYLYYRRFAYSVDAAISWYKAALTGNPVLPADPEHPKPGEGVSLQGGSFVEEPPWPGLVASNDLGFAPDWMQGARVHFLFPKSILSQKIVEIIRNDKIQKKLLEWLNFDIVDTYPEYQGAICLVAPNPLFRSIEKSNLDLAHPGCAESVAYKIVARQGQCLDGLRLEVINERPRGRMRPFVHEFGAEAIAVFDSQAEVYKEGQSVTHPDHELLSWHEPLPILRTMHVSMEVIRRRKSVQVPALGRRRPVSEYEVDEVEDAGKVIAGDELDNKPIVSRMTEADNLRSRREAARVYDQKWFRGAPAEAQHYVRQKIGSAHNNVFIIDPYFAGRELLAFGHAIRRPNVQLRILTSELALKGAGQDGLNAVSGSQLFDILNETFRDYSKKPEIRVLTAKPPPVHDRFLVVDENIWLSGNSLSTIGERAGMIVRLPDPAPVTAELDSLWGNARTLSQWLSDRRTTPVRGRLSIWFDHLKARICRR